MAKSVEPIKAKVEAAKPEPPVKAEPVPVKPAPSKYRVSLYPGNAEVVEASSEAEAIAKYNEISGVLSSMHKHTVEPVEG